VVTTWHSIWRAHANNHLVIEYRL